MKLYGEVPKINTIHASVGGNSNHCKNCCCPKIPTKTSQLTNDSNFVSDANYVHTDYNFKRQDKLKLTSVEYGANNYIHPAYIARTGKPISNLTPGFGERIVLSQVVSDATGHITDIVDREITMPWSEATHVLSGLMTPVDKVKLDGIESGANNYVHPYYTSRTGKPTGNEYPNFGGTFVISQVISDITGHVVSMTDRTIKIPNTSATTISAGLMSTSQVTKLNSIAQGAQVNKIESISLNNVVQEIDANKNVNLNIVTDIDNTLSRQNVAAEAKATGDAINNLRNEFINETAVDLSEIKENITLIKDAIGIVNGSLENLLVSGGDSQSVDVRFIDYDGTIVTTYTKEEFLALSEMPENPTHAGLTSQGWNWSLADAQEYVTDYGKLDIGQMYITDDGKTRLYVHFEEGRSAPYLGIGLDGTVTIDWGDDSSTDTLTGNSFVTVQHTFQPGDYVITLTPSSGTTYSLLGDSSSGSRILNKTATGIATESYVYHSSIKKVELGESVSIGNNAFHSCFNLSSITIHDGVTSIGTSAFNSCYNLSSITFPYSITGISNTVLSRCYHLVSVSIPDGVTTIGTSAFQNCYHLVSVTIPDGVTTIDTNAFQNCYSLNIVTIPDSVTRIGTGVFQNCYSLIVVTIPDGVTTIDTNTFSSCPGLTNITISDGVKTIGNNAFTGCMALENITIPDSVTSILSSSFSNCFCLVNITISDGVTTIGNNAFNNCYTLSNITIPDSVTTIGAGAFSNCTCLTSITIPDSVTTISRGAFSNCSALASVSIPNNMTSIADDTFGSCYLLTNITIPDSVTSIGSSVFYCCYGLSSFKFCSSTPPTVSNINTFSYIPTDCKIYVPAGSLTAYTTATNYPDPNTYTYVEY